MFRWLGYIRKIERTEWMVGREIVSIIYNVNAKKGKQKSGRNLFPLEIDNILIFTPEQAEANYQAAIKAGWFSNNTLN